MNEPVSFSKNSPRFSPEEQTRFREMFAPIAQQYRKGSRRAYVILGVGAAIILTGFLLPKIYTGWVVGAFFICWLTYRESWVVFAPSAAPPTLSREVGFESLTARVVARVSGEVSRGSLQYGHAHIAE